MFGLVWFYILLDIVRILMYSGIHPILSMDYFAMVIIYVTIVHEYDIAQNESITG